MELTIALSLIVLSFLTRVLMIRKNINPTITNVSYILLIALSMFVLLK